MFYLPYLCLFAYSGVQHILCCVFVLFFFVLCTLCKQFLWIVHFWFPLQCSIIENFKTEPVENLNRLRKETESLALPLVVTMIRVTRVDRKYTPILLCDRIERKHEKHDLLLQNMINSLIQRHRSCSNFYKISMFVLCKGSLGFCQNSTFTHYLHSNIKIQQTIKVGNRETATPSTEYIRKNKPQVKRCRSVVIIIEP